MTLEFDFVPHNINNIYQTIRYKTSFTRHLLINTRNQNLWNKLLSIDPYSLCINKDNNIYVVIDILQTLKHLVTFYTKRYNLEDNETEEIKSYDVLLVYLQNRLKNGKPKTYKKIVKNK